MKTQFLVVLTACVLALGVSAMDASYVQNEVSIPYTPTTAVSAGDVLVLSNGLVAVANQDIAVGALGAVQLRGVFRLAKDTSTTYMGQLIYWDADGSQYGNATTNTGAASTTSTDNTWCGFAVEAKGATDNTVEVMLYPVGNVDASTLTVAGAAALNGGLTVTGTIIGSSTVAATGFKIGAVSGWSGVVTNVSTLATNVFFYSGGVVTNVTRNP